MRENKLEFAKKSKRSIINELFGESLFDETKLFEEFPESGYSINVTQTPEGTKVKAKVGKGTHANALQKQYPDAQIEGGKKEPLNREISTKTLKNENNK